MSKFTSVTEKKIFNGFMLAARDAFHQDGLEKISEEGFLTTDSFICSISGLNVADVENFRERVTLVKGTVIDLENLGERRFFPALSEVRFLAEGQIRFFLPPFASGAIAAPVANGVMTFPEPRCWCNCLSWFPLRCGSSRGEGALPRMPKLQLHPPITAETRNAGNLLLLKGNKSV